MRAPPLNNNKAAAAPSMVPRRPPELLGSTSDLLAVLHLNEIPTTNIVMDDLESDPAVLEVPDTPDRLAMARRRNRGGGSTELNDADHMHVPVEVPDTPDSPANVSPGVTPPRRRTGHMGNTYQRRGSGHCNVGGSDSEHIRRHARLKRLNSKTLDSKASPDAPCRKSAKIVDVSWTSPIRVSHPRRNNGEDWCGESSVGFLSNEDDVELKNNDEGKMIDLVTDVEAKTEQVLTEIPQLDSSRTITGQRRLRSNGFLSRCNTLRGNIQSKADRQNNLKLFGGGSVSTSGQIRDQDNREQVDTHRLDCYANCDKIIGNGKTPIEYLDSDLLDHVTIVRSGSEANLVDGKKGKLKLDDNTESNVQCKEGKIRRGRSNNTSDKEVTVIADGTGSSEDLGWRTTRNHTRKAPTYSSHEISGALGREDTKNHLSEQSHDVSVEDVLFTNLLHASPQMAVSRHELNTNPSRASSESESESRRHRRQKLMKGKGKHSSLRSISGGSSSSVFEDSEMPYLESSAQSTNFRTITTLGCQRPGAISGPVIENDDMHSPDVRCRNPQEQSCRVDDSSARSRQVESDEILARQLQEQFYHESQGSGGTEETDATIAWSLQEEEDARRAASFMNTRSVQSPRDASIAHLYGQYSGSSFQHTSAQSTNRAQVPTSRRGGRLRRNFNRPEVDQETRMLANLRRNFNSTEMDVEMRVNFLEALEAAFDNSNDMEYDFNEDDYEMLLTLDDNNHEHVGASESRINTLPQSVIQSDGIGEVCAVCLDTPSSGDVIRHLPCLHKFHIECIDTWLRRRATCPICKSGIS